MNSKHAISSMWSLADKPERMRCFHKIVFDLGISDAKVFWEEFWSIWTSSENLNDDEDYIRELVEFGLTLGDPHSALEDEELKVLKALPEEVVVYRGCLEINQHGWSWTTDIEKAKWFANRAYGSTERMLLTGKVSKANVLAYLTGRSENEIVADPDQVDYKIQEEWESDDAGSALFYAIQSGRFGNNPEADQFRAEMIVKGLSDDSREETLKNFEEALEFIRWADLKSKRGYLEAVVEMLKENVEAI